MDKNITELMQIAEKFQIDGMIEQIKPHGNGHINDTYLLTCHSDSQKRHYILQRMNHDVFKDPIGLMENIIGVTTFLRKKLLKIVAILKEKH